ncbi:Type II secretion envelope pseudopilin protein (PulG,guides folded protein to PulD in outer membrane) [hydrothermal vent metagenome]|uniref:Type II secretion envelope pseudopilin protein (PulG,guides folded protein to PulD in outer membrane) n=1 Tax=hydrothermal vent metagenome TaxID=652676 RepID=A0A1W1CXR4_9ZZZZ
MRRAFSMVELVFVIVVIGILSAIAVPKFSATRDDAVITRGRTAVASLRSALSTLRQKNILKGVFDDINGSALEAEIEYGLGSDWNRTDNVFTFSCPSSHTCDFNITSNKLVKGNCDTSCGMDDL